MDEDASRIPLEFFRALADEERLALAGLLARGERTMGDLAAATGLAEPVVARHLAKLAAIGLVRTSAGRHALDRAALQAMKRAVLARERPADPADAETGDARARKVLRDFFDGDRLKAIPADRQKRAIVLDWLADRFAPGRRYPEPEVNAIIKRHHPDSATLRRELVDGRWLARESGVYWRLERE